MQPDLSSHLHTLECNVLIQLLQRCQEEHIVGRLFGKCSDWDEAVWQCTKKERIWRRDNNPRYKKRIVELQRLPVSHWTPAVKRLHEEGLLPKIDSSQL
ncbi:unnamed protein product, partial [Mesorhabditis belari]|uniref:COX assembly mitochondrial protein n=1 Tax=Mesorhabditis belari TaxID=2138241 RepID=A0AAF3ESR9_9BILA